MRNHFLGLFLLLGAALPAMSQPFEAALSFGQSMISNKDIGSGYSLDDGFRFGFRITLNSGRFTGYEFGYGYNRSHLKLDNVDQGGMAIHQGGFNYLLYATPEGSRFRPFATGGGHFANYVPPGASASYGQGSTKFGFNYGGGVKVRLNGPFMIRFDFRQYQNGRPFGLPGAPGGLLRQNEISGGFGIAL